MGRGTDHFVRWRYDVVAMLGFAAVVAGLGFGLGTLLIPADGSPPWPLGVVALAVAGAGVWLCRRRWRQLDRPPTWTGNRR